MCGIIGIVGAGNVTPLAMEALRRLEYRGYDSAGVAVLTDGHIERRRAQGKLINLDARLAEDPIAGPVGIGHTRWATHGGPTEANAHPHATPKVAVVHNGIIENYRALKAEMLAEGRTFESETDTEIVAHLVTSYLEQGHGPADAVALTLKRLKGAFALALLFAGHDDLVIGARRGSPLAVGFGDHGTFVASDAVALAGMASRILYLEEGDWVEVRRGGAVVHDQADAVVERAVRATAVSGALIGKGNYRHYMLKEIHEQPQVLGDTLNAFVHPSTGEIALPNLDVDWATIPRLTIVACGTAYYAGLVAKYWMERIARLPVEIDVASEFRYRQPPLPKGGVALFVSQSGETMDTLEALRYAKREGQAILGVINAPESTMTRESDAVMYTHAGPEIGVASTKAFTTQLAVLGALTLAVARARGTITVEEEQALATALAEVPSRAAEVLRHDKAIEALSAHIAEARDVLYLGRGGAYPIAMEGALKLKEISYIHAEGYPAGEMKHGPIALVADDVPVIVVAPHDELFEKTASNVAEVAARGGKVLLLSDAAGIETLKDRIVWSIEMPTVHPFAAPILYALPIQLLAYHVAVRKGTDVDQPRNLAKSVTVE